MLTGRIKVERRDRLCAYRDDRIDAAPEARNVFASIGGGVGAGEVSGDSRLGERDCRDPRCASAAAAKGALGNDRSKSASAPGEPVDDDADMGGLKGVDEPARLGVPDEIQLSVGVLPRTGKGRKAVGPSDVGLPFIMLESDGLSAYNDSLAYGSVSDLSYTVCVRAARSSIQFEKRAGVGADFRLRRRQI